MSRKRYEVKRFGYYPDDWIDNDTNKSFTSLQVEKILNKQYKQLKTQDEKISELEKQLKQARNELIDEIIKKATINSPYNPKTNKPKQVLVINLLDLKELRNKEND